MVVQFLTSQQTWDHYAALLQHLLLVSNIAKVCSCYSSNPGRMFSM